MTISFNGAVINERVGDTLEIKYVLDLRDFVDNDMVRRALPNKALAIRIDDVAKIFEES